MRWFDVICNGDSHQIGIDRDGGIVLKNHDIEEEEALQVMGLPVSECYQHLMQLESDPNDYLEYIICFYHSELIPMAVYAGADVRSEHGQQCMTQFAMSGKEGLVRLFLESGADVHFDNEAALVEAARRGYPRIVKLLLEYGANAKAITPGDLYNIYDKPFYEVHRLLAGAGAGAKRPKHV